MGGDERPFRRSGVQVLGRRPTMIDVAKEAGVALKTVSRVVNDEPGVRAATAERVNRAIARLRYRRNDFARRLRSHSPTATFGLLVDDVGSQRAAAITSGVEAAVRELGWLVVVGGSGGDPERERQLVTAMVERQVDGLIVMPAGDDHRYLLPEVRRGTPAVFLDRPAGGVEADVVLVDDRAGARTAVAALLAAGHHQIGVVGGPPTAGTVAGRLAGWREALGAPDEGQLVRLGLADVAGAEAAASELLSAAEPPSALLALSSGLAPGVVRAAAAAGAAVLVFDRLPLGDLLPVPVWTIDYDAADLGRRGAELLLDRLDGNAGPARRVVLPTTLQAPYTMSTHGSGSSRPDRRSTRS